MVDKPYINAPERKSFATQLKERIQSSFLEGTGPDSLYEALRGRLKLVSIDDQELYVAEGDTLLDEDQLWLYSLHRERLAKEAQNRNLFGLGGLGVASLTNAQPSGLMGMVDEQGRFIRWDENFVLTYCVLKKTFAGTDRLAHYHTVVECVEQATREWQEVCGVQFEYKPELDDSHGVRPIEVVFPVRELDTGGAFIAAAFFPNDPEVRRRVVIDPSFYKNDLIFDKVGVLRHELGHVLGFRHEHIRSGAPRECPGEELSATVDLTAYDPGSVMHYFCGGLGSRELAITSFDRIGAERLYGPPAGPAGLMPSMSDEIAEVLSRPLPQAFVR